MLMVDLSKVTRSWIRRLLGIPPSLFETLAHLKLLTSPFDYRLVKTNGPVECIVQYDQSQVYLDGSQSRLTIG